MFRKGEWVVIVERSWYVNKKPQAAFIISHENEPDVKVYVPSDKKERWASKRNLESYEGILPEAKEDAKPVLIEMSLMTKDENLFWEVTTG